jgi:protein tyrosine/serine phosphatase
LQAARFLILCLTFSAGAATIQDAPGVPNFHKVDENVFRGAQPTPAGFQNLAKLGVKTIIDLRRPDEHAGEKQVVEGLGMRYISVPMRGMAAPTKDQMKEVFAVLHDSRAWPVFVHCRQGKDRTGTVVACYRIEHQGWQNRRALQEARDKGLHWVEKAMQHYILRFEGNHASYTAVSDGRSGPVQPAAAP